MPGTILYIHGMGGGGDSRIPRYLSQRLSSEGIRVVVRTYSFDPETGAGQIAAWREELAPDLVIGESLGALQAMRICGIPHLYVSPALGAPYFMYRFAWITRLPGGASFLGRIWSVKEGDRQRLCFSYPVLRKYKAHASTARQCARAGDSHFAFFGKRDHYRKWGIVRISSWRKMFGDTYQIYDGSHFMEEEFLDSMLVPKIRSLLAAE